MPIITVSHVTKEFRLGQVHSARDAVLRFLARARGKAPATKQLFKALDDVSFSVEQGEVLGIIGANGAGKSTMLKLLAQITVPTSGQVSVKGRIAPLIEVGAGLISDLTGRENIYLNGIILGMPYAEVKKKFDEIVAFAELEEFIETPIKRYSSGMAVRLGFSLATCVDADILIVDEVLSVGDLAFQRKCFDRMEDMIKRQGKTVLLVSHNMRQVERLCTRVILLDHGRIIADDAPVKVCDLFYERSDRKIKLSSEQGRSTRWTNTLGTNDIQITDVRMFNASGHATEAVEYKADVSVRIRFVTHTALKVPVFLIGVHTTDFLYLTRNHSDRQIKVDFLEPGNYEVVCRISRFPLLPGIYAILFGIGEGVVTTWLFYAENLVNFQVTSNSVEALSADDRGSFLALDADWSYPAPVESAEPKINEEANVQPIRG